MDINGMLEPPQNDEPPMNAAIEHCLAMSGYDQASQEMTLRAWLTIGCEYLAREVGRKRAIEVVNDLEAFLRIAKPSREWPK